MKTIVTCGHPLSGYQDVHALLRAAGLEEAAAATGDDVTPGRFHELVLQAHEADGRDNESGPLKPGLFWQRLAADLFMANMSRPLWGWADAATVRLLDFWAGFEASVRFVLVYCSPAALAARAVDQGLPPGRLDDLLQDWADVNAEMLRFYNSHPTRCLLVDAEAVAAAPGRFADLASQRFNLPAPTRPAAGTAPPAGAPDAAIRYFAGVLQGRRPGLESLANELASSADLPGEPGSDADAEAALRQYAALLADRRAGAEALAALADKEAGCRERLAAAVAEASSAARQADRLSEAEATCAALQDAAQENGQLVIRLHQVQEELEHYYKQFEAAAGQRDQAAQALALYREAWLGLNPGEWLVDLRGDFSGDGWHGPEHDGRWAGPETVSRIRTPALRPGVYLAGLRVVAAIEPDILAGIGCALNGEPVEFQIFSSPEGTLVAMAFATPPLADAPVWEFSFTFPRLVSPASQGADPDDHRLLAVRAASLQLSWRGPC